MSHKSCLQLNITKFSKERAIFFTNTDFTQRNKGEKIDCKTCATAETSIIESCRNLMTKWYIFHNVSNGLLLQKTHPFLTHPLLPNPHLALAMIQCAHTYPKNFSRMCRCALSDAVNGYLLLPQPMRWDFTIWSNMKDVACEWVFSVARSRDSCLGSRFFSCGEATQVNGPLWPDFEKEDLGE